jgi:hypothetical protein
MATVPTPSGRDARHGGGGPYPHHRRPAGRGGARRAREPDLGGHPAMAPLQSPGRAGRRPAGRHGDADRPAARRRAGPHRDRRLYRAGRQQLRRQRPGKPDRAAAGEDRRGAAGDLLRRPQPDRRRRFPGRRRPARRGRRRGLRHAGLSLFRLGSGAQAPDRQAGDLELVQLHDHHPARPPGLGDTGVSLVRDAGGAPAHRPHRLPDRRRGLERRGAAQGGAGGDRPGGPAAGAGQRFRRAPLGPA